MGDSSWAVIIGAISANLIALIGGAATVWAGRRKAVSEIQGVINSGFTELVDTLRGQVKFQSERIDELERVIRVREKQITTLKLFIRNSGKEVPKLN